VAALVSAAVLLAPFSAHRAEAETIFLKDGTKIPCRILLEGEEEIVVRMAGGMEVSYKKKNIDRIDRSVSSVEIYEGVAERISAGNFTAALYLGYWCLENDLESEARKFFKVAARDDTVAGRALLALAGLTSSRALKRPLIARAVVADPALPEAVAALAESRATQAELPQDLVKLGSRLFAALPSGSSRDVLRYLSSVERYPNVAARTAYAERFRAYTGLSFADIRQRCGARRSSSRRGMSSRSVTEDGRCVSCRDAGYTQCPICKGNGYKLCRTCRGAGTKTVKKHSSAHGSRTFRERCPGCKGAAAHDCRACIRLPSGPKKISKGLTTEKSCGACGGVGKSKATVTTSTRTGTSYVTMKVCLDCRGTGKIPQSHRVSLTVTSSGRRRCNTCNADGSIPFSTDGSTQSGGFTSRTTISRDTGVFGPEERDRLMALREVFASAGEGVGLRWQAGPKVPFTFAVHAKDKEDDKEVFAFGQWCTRSMRDLKARTAKALGHKPREVDVSEFSGWMRDRELAYLRSRSKPFGRAGTGGTRVGDVKALVAALECAGRAGVVGGLEHSTVMRTTFSPRRGGREAPLVCNLDISARGPALVLLRDATSWPADEVLLSPVSEERSGFDFKSLMRTVRAAPKDLTLYYRIRSYHREAVGRGAAAMTNVVLSAQVLAATLGPENRPTKVWLRQAFKD
jgi:hypothetical protein